MSIIPPRFKFQDTQLQDFVNAVLHCINGNIDNDNLKSTVRGSNDSVYGETPIPSVDASTTVFYTLSAYAKDTLRVRLNGIDQVRDTDYTEGIGNYFTMTTAPAADMYLRVDYVKG